MADRELFSVWRSTRAGDVGGLLVTCMIVTVCALVGMSLSGCHGREPKPKDEVLAGQGPGITNPAANQPERRDRVFADVAEDIVRSIAARDVTSFRNEVSDRGLQVARTVWTGVVNVNKPRHPSLGDSYLTDLRLGGTPTVWEERILTFTKDELNGEVFAGILEQFQTFVGISEKSYGGVEYSLNMADQWGSFFLGPAAGGKLFAGGYWFVRFVREDEEWRVRRLEWIAH